MATFMEVLDTSIANVALPHIAGSLSASTDESAWVLSLLCGERGDPADQRVAGDAFWAQAILHDVRSAVRHQLTPVRIRDVAIDAGFLPRDAGPGRWWACSQRTGHFGRYISTAKTRDGIRYIRNGGGAERWSSVRRWADILRIISTGVWIFFINGPGRHRLADSHVPPGGRSATFEGDVRQGGEGGMNTVGLGLIAVGVGAGQVVLDKGQREDWFSSPFILWFPDYFDRRHYHGDFSGNIIYKNPIIDILDYSRTVIFPSPAS